MQVRHAAKNLELKRVRIIEAIDNRHLLPFRRQRTRLAGSTAIVDAGKARIAPRTLIHALRAK
jgi:hypothetical protein